MDKSHLGAMALGVLFVIPLSFGLSWGQNPIPWTYTISSMVRFHNPLVETGSLSGPAPGGYSWAATGNAPWITSGPSGSGNETVAYSVSANPGANTRTGTLTIAEQTFTVAQSGACTYLLSPTSRNHNSGAETGSVRVTIPSGCAWGATCNASWITIMSFSSEIGNGTVTYSVSANPGTNARTGTMTIAGQAFTVTQSGLKP
jgi:hypothetical protein